MDSGASSRARSIFSILSFLGSPACYNPVRGAYPPGASSLISTSPLLRLFIPQRPSFPNESFYTPQPDLTSSSLRHSHEPSFSLYLPQAPSRQGQTLSIPSSRRLIYSSTERATQGSATLARCSESEIRRASRGMPVKTVGTGKKTDQPAIERTWRSEGEADGILPLPYLHA